MSLPHNKSQKRKARHTESQFEAMSMNGQFLRWLKESLSSAGIAPAFVQPAPDDVETRLNAFSYSRTYCC